MANGSICMKIRDIKIGECSAIIMLTVLGKSQRYRDLQLRFRLRLSGFDK